MITIKIHHQKGRYRSCRSLRQIQQHRKRKTPAVFHRTDNLNFLPDRSSFQCIIFLPQQMELDMIRRRRNDTIQIIFIKFFQLRSAFLNPLLLCCYLLTIKTGKRVRQFIRKNFSLINSVTVLVWSSCHVCSRCRIRQVSPGRYYHMHLLLSRH